MVEAVLVEIGKAHTFVEYPVYEVTKDILRKLESSVSGTWIMAVCRMPQYHDAEFGKRVIVLDDVPGSGNKGECRISRIIRTLRYPFGYDAVLLSVTAADIYNEKVIRSTQGSLVSSHSGDSGRA